MIKRGILVVLIGVLFSCGKNADNVPPEVITSPIFFQLPVGGTLQLSAQILGAPDNGVNWQLFGPGEVNPDGLYTAPSTLPTNASVSVRATSKTDPNLIGTVAIILQPAMEGFPLPVAQEGGGPVQVILGLTSINASSSVGLSNSQGRADLVTANNAASSISIFPSDEFNRFVESEPPVESGAASQRPVALAAGIFVNDKPGGAFLADVAVAMGDAISGVGESNPEVVVIPGNTNRNFSIGRVDPNDLNSPEMRTPIGLEPGDSLIDIGSGDFDLDGNDDLAVVTDQGSVRVLIGDGNGLFAVGPPVDVGGGPADLIVADFNNDRGQDVVTANAGDRSLTVLLGDGEGGFRPRIDVPLSGAPTALAIGDFNRDQRLDLVVAQPNENQVVLLQGFGNGTFRPPLIHEMDIPNSFPNRVTVADLNLDGFVDVAVTQQNSDSVTILFRENIELLRPDRPFVGSVTYDNDNTFDASFLSNEPLFDGPNSLVAFFLSGFEKIGLAVLNGGSSKLTLLIP